MATLVKGFWSPEGAIPPLPESGNRFRYRWSALLVRCSSFLYFFSKKSLDFFGRMYWSNLTSVTSLRFRKVWKIFHSYLLSLESRSIRASIPLDFGRTMLLLLNVPDGYPKSRLLKYSHTFSCLLKVVSSVKLKKKSDCESIWRHRRARTKRAGYKQFYRISLYLQIINGTYLSLSVPIKESK